MMMATVIMIIQVSPNEKRFHFKIDDTITEEDIGGYGNVTSRRRT